MMRTIENSRQLRKEISRLKNELSLKEQNIKDRVRDVRTDLRPENLFYQAISSVTGINLKSGLLKGIIELVKAVVNRFSAK